MSSCSSPEVACADEQQEPFSYKHATHDEILEELESRFILNLPEDELASLDRICFQIEQAHWFYEDFVREQNSKFPSYPLKKFSAMMFSYSSLLRRWGDDHETIFNTFMQYKTRVPVCGAIMLNDTWDKCVLVKGWKSSSGWGFPKGKINEDEPQTTCAVREVLEETGYNLAGKIDPDNVIEMSIRDQKIALYVVPGVPEDFPFKTKTRKEISKIQWFKLADLPTWKRNKGAPGKFYLITPFIAPLKAFIHDRKPRDSVRKAPRSAKATKMNSRKEHPKADQSTQESSSQSSADPHTPSPQYSQQIPAVHDPASASLPDNLDPHFARLLSSLTLSGTNALKKQSVAEVKVSEALPLPSKQTIPPPQSTSPNSSADSTRVHPDTSLSASCSVPSPPLPSNVPKFSPRSSRRTSSMADISPYMSSNMPGIQLSARRMKHLALLESVADESARMSPVLKNTNDRLRYSMTPSFPDPSQSDSSFPFLSNPHSATLHHSPSINDLIRPQSTQDPFVARSRTSHALQRPPHHPLHGSMSMSQSQVLSFMNPHIATPPVSPGVMQQPPPLPGVYLPYKQQSLDHNLLGASTLPPPTYRHLPGPLLPNSSQFLSSQLSPTRLTATNNTLLSILNGTVSPSGPTGPA